MKKRDRLREREFEAAATLLLALGLTACSSGGPAPVVTGDLGGPPPTQITVQHGQTLSGIALAHRIPMLTLAEANHLTPPYRIITGQALIIPKENGTVAYQPKLAAAEPRLVPNHSSPSSFLASPPDSSRPAAAPAMSPVPEAQRVIPSDRAPNTTKAPVEVKPPIPLGQPSPATLPSGSTPPLKPGLGVVPSGSVPQPSVSALAPQPTTDAKGVTAAAEPPLLAHGGRNFLWPVRGRVLAGYGAGPTGERNDGINIAAPRGAAIEAADNGIVAYSGNELRGYGNLILIKHPSGWISAYAHCDLMLVKTGQKVARGQVIARVGATGNVGEPQLHFELRRGKRPVDPRDYLPPLSTAVTREAKPG